MTGQLIYGHRFVAGFSLRIVVSVSRFKLTLTKMYCLEICFNGNTLSTKIDFTELFFGRLSVIS